MRAIRILPLLLAIASEVAMPQSPRNPIDAAAWLAGCWSSDGREKGSGEHWLQPAGGTMLGVSRMIKDGKTVAYEFMQIKADATGNLVFVATPSGQPEATFSLSSHSEGHLVFENPSHDFPQRIAYQAKAGGKLHARVEGKRSGVQRAIDFPMSRVACQEL